MRTDPVDVESLVSALEPAVQAWSQTFAEQSRDKRAAALGAGDLQRRQVGGHRWLPWALANGVNPVDCEQVAEALPAWGDHLEQLCDHGLIAEWTAYNCWSSARSWHRWAVSHSGLGWSCPELDRAGRRWPWLVDPQRARPAVVLTVAEIASLIRAADHLTAPPVSRRRTHALICVLAATGCRISEAAGMLRSELRLGAREGAVRYRTKGGRRHHASLPEWCVKALRRYFDARSVTTGRLLGEEPVFAPVISASARWTHASPAALRGQVAELGRVAGIGRHVTPHTIRASLITRARERGDSVDDVMQWSGHRDRRSIEHYDRRNRGAQIGAELADEIAEALAT